jgi:hypothetical protein
VYLCTIKQRSNDAALKKNKIMTTASKVATQIIHGRFSGATTGFNSEVLQQLADKVQAGLEIEDPNEEYSEEDKHTSIVGFLECEYTEDELLKILQS